MVAKFVMVVMVVVVVVSLELDKGSMFRETPRAVTFHSTERVKRTSVTVRVLVQN